MNIRKLVLLFFTVCMAAFCYGNGGKEPDVLILCKKLHSAAIKANVAILAVVNQNTDNTELLKFANVYVTKPINEKILTSCINGSLKFKKAIDTLSMNNNELAKSLVGLII